MATLDNARLRNSAPAELVAYFQSLLIELDWKYISDYLITSVASGAVFPTVFHVWLSVCKEPDAVAAVLQQNISVLARKVAIRRFGKWLRTDNGFPAVWDAVGKTDGVLALMASMSVDEVAVFCETLESSCTARSAVEVRQRCMTSLFDALCNTAGNRADVPRNPDTRPLIAHYKRIVPACTPATALAWSDAENHRLARKACDAHATSFEARAIAAMFPGKGEGKKLNMSRHLMSQSQTFTILVLKRLTTNNIALKANKDMFMETVAIPLLRRLTHKREPDHVHIQALELILECIQKEPSISEKIRWGKQDILFYAIQAWKRSREGRGRLQDILGILISLMPAHTSSNLESATSMLQTVSPSVRYQLLKLILRNAKSCQVDLDSCSDDEGDKRLKEMDQKWNTELFTLLPPVPALELLNRLFRVHPAADFITIDRFGGHSITKSREPDGDCFGDAEIMLAYLSARAVQSSKGAECLPRTRKAIKDRKNKANFALEWEDRAKWAKAALLLSIAAGSIEVYGKTLLWARRFNGDSLTIRAIFQEDTMLTEEGLQLLSATPLRRFTKSKFDLEKIKADIEAANKVMLQLLETVSMGLREPTFVRFYWNSVFLLIPQVIRARMDRAHEYGVPSQDIFDNIWEPTIDMLLGAERFGLRDGHEKLLYRDIYGPFVHWEPVRNPGLATCEFLDRLAMARDDLWRDYRAKVRPAVTALPKPWPRGLAIQQLLPDLKGQLHMPYLESRVKDTVFADGALALSPPPSDDETCEAIGPFVDDYDYALKHYLTTNASEFKTRVHAAWNHALDKLNGSRMSTEEATRFWRTKFRRAVQGTDTSLPDDIAPSYKKLRLTLPSDDGTANPTEWNPVPIEKTVPIERRQLPECILDCMLNCISSKWSSPTIDSAFSSERKSWTAEDDYPLILWDDCSSRLFPRGAGDALAAAAIAYINTKYGSDASLLLYPFPSKDDLRFPALYLDQDFLERVSKITDVSQPLESIKMLSCVMPVQFLVQLARSLMTRLAKNETDDPDVRQATMAVTKCVTRGDRPVLACELVQQVVLGQQDDSSWHRHLFSIRFLRRLSAREAHSFFDGLSSRVEEASQKLAQEQAKKRAAKAAQPQVPSQKTSTGLPSAASDDASQYFQPVVKVTTVKMIVQMLSRANFLDQQFACNILVRLLKCASHADIRVAIVESLLEILADNTDQNLESTVFDVLEEYVTPLAASMNERRPTTEEEWTAAEAGDAPLPAVAEETPILNLLMSALNKWKPNSPRRQQFLKRILEPTIVESGHNNRRWNAIFIQRHGFNISVNYLPTIPAVPSLFLQHFQSEAECWTRANLEVAKQFAAVNLCPSDSLVATNEAVRNDPELLRSNAGKHWLSLWSNPGSEAFPLGINQAANILARLVPSPEKGRLSVLEIQDFLLQWVEYFLMGSRTPELNELLSHLIPGRSKSYPKTIWLTNCLPVLQHVLTRVQSLRTDEWQCDTNREPATLPDTLSLKLKIFKEKHTTSKPNSHWESHIRTMVADASSLLDELLAEDAPYHENWPKFKNYMNIAPREHHVRVALEFTTPEISGKTKIGLKEYLKIEIADELLQSGSDPNDNEVVTRAHQLLHAWLGSPVERIRLRGEATSNLLETRAKSRNGWFQ